MNFSSGTKSQEVGISLQIGPGSLKDYRYHDFPNTEFFYFLTIDTRQ